MDVLAEPSKWQRVGFLSSLNRSFRLNGGKSKSSPTETKTMELTLEISATVRTYLQNS